MEGRAASRPRFYGGGRQAAAERLQYVQQAPEEADDEGKPVDGDSLRLTDKQARCRWGPVQLLLHLQHLRACLC